MPPAGEEDCDAPCDFCGHISNQTLWVEGGDFEEAMQCVVHADSKIRMHEVRTQMLWLQHRLMLLEREMVEAHARVCMCHAPPSVTAVRE